MALKKKEKQELNAEDLLMENLDGLDALIEENSFASAEEAQDFPPDESPEPFEDEAETSPAKETTAEEGESGSTGHSLPGKITKRYSGSLVMKILRSKADGKLVSEALKNAPRKGYLLIRKKDGVVYNISETENVGSDESFATILINDNRTVSRKHARLDVEGDTLLITDLGSSNGTKVNGYPLEPNETYELSYGNEVVFSDEVFVVAEAEI